MTYGESDGSTIPPPDPPPIPDAKPFDTNNIPGFTTADGTPDNANLTPPDVPGNKGDGKGGGGKTEVHTATLKLFADNIDKLKEPLNNALTKLQDLKPIAAGDFNTGHTMKTMITGNDGTGMLQSGFETVVKKSLKSVTDVHEAISKLAKDYDNADELNKMTGQQLNRALDDNWVNTDIGAVGDAGSAFGKGGKS
jgi:hypothetical protein